MPAFMSFVKLDDAEYADALEYAKNKFEYSRKVGYGGLTYSPCGETQVEVNDKGMVAEWAVPMVLGLNPKEVLSTSSPDDGFDFMYCGKKIEVKSTKYHKGKLIVNTTDLSKPWDFVLLIVGGGREYRVAGYMSHKEMEDRGGATRIGEWRQGSGCTAEQHELHPWENLERACGSVGAC